MSTQFHIIPNNTLVLIIDDATCQIYPLPHLSSTISASVITDTTILLLFSFSFIFDFFVFLVRIIMFQNIAYWNRMTIKTQSEYWGRMEGTHPHTVFLCGKTTSEAEEHLTLTHWIRIIFHVCPFSYSFHRKPILHWSATQQTYGKKEKNEIEIVMWQQERKDHSVLSFSLTNVYW